jgi:TRAP-type C4-dicarboxylate transport system substrate-binding protein
MKKTLILVFLLVFAFSMVLVACEEETTTTEETTATTAAEVTTTSVYEPGTWKFTFNTFFPASNQIAIVGEMWQAEITERTGGAVEFEYLPGGSLTPPAETYDAVVNGICDVGFSLGAYTLGKFPVNEILDYPLGYPSGWVATHVANDFYAEFQPAEFDETHVLAWYATGPQVVLTVDTPVRTLADCSGLVLRSTGVGAKIAGYLGAEGYGASQGEAYELMQKGTINGSIAPREVLKGWNQADVVNYVTQCFSIGSVTNMYMVMNKDKWDELPADIQQIFTDVSLEYVEYWAKVSAGLDYDGIAALEAKGGEVIDLSAEEGARWLAAVRPMVDAKIAELSAAGFTDDYETYITDRIAYWAASAPTEEECSAWMAENIKSPSAQ